MAGPDGAVMRCMVCRAALEHEAFTAMWFNGDREAARIDVKGVAWLWRTRNYLDPDFVIACSHRCITKWQGGQAAFPVQKLPEYRAPHVEPREKLVSMTTDKFEVSDIEAIYGEVLIAGIPKQTPPALIRDLVERHGRVEKLIVDAPRGVAYASFAEGEHGERFFMSSNCLKLSARGLPEGVTPPALDVEFLHYLPALNAHLFDDMLGNKPTRQLLRAMPRRHPLPKEYAASDAAMAPVFAAWEKHVAALRQSEDYRLLQSEQGDRQADPGLLITRNWVLHKYNLQDSYKKARCLYRKAGQDLNRAMAMIEYTHINQYYDEEGGAPRKQRPAAPAPKGLRLWVSLLGSLMNVHAIAIFGLVAAIAALANNLA
eukprot:TRINITY_DN15307_c0_g2_i1.p1 TRINITY_DN15307_c0_g2~~TRINITY_DN15307_c0_g2_i1.p1  ORF type:complete len:387 (+),score=129.46 TRINITY_DN15307_c0_g2_i1:46-1161(+)